MNVRITPSLISGEVKMISSKSQAHRMLICAALAEGESHLICERTNEDILATIDCLNAMGAVITLEGDTISVKPLSGDVHKAEMCCRESGSTLRFILPVVCALGIEAEIEMWGRLPERPMDPLTDELKRHGALIEKCGNKLYTGGRLQAGDYSIPGNISSQYVSGLLFALSAMDAPGSLEVTGEVQSGSYIEMTLRAMEAFEICPKRNGYRFNFSGSEKAFGRDMLIEGDWSNAAFWLCAGALSDKGITLKNLDMASPQGDKAIVDILIGFGAHILANDAGIHIRSGELKGVEIDAGDIPDLIPVISAFACAAKGDTIIRNAERLRIKESDRLAAICEMLNILGADFTPTEDGLIIHGGKVLKGGELSAHNDHRMAMTAAVASMICDGEITVVGAECVKKSYPDFWDAFTSLGGRIERIDS